jgi:hypothetical protein
MYNNLINVERYLGQQKNARALREEARRLYPEDRRFHRSADAGYDRGLSVAEAAEPFYVYCRSGLKSIDRI